MHWLQPVRIIVALFCLGLPVASFVRAEDELAQPTGGTAAEEHPADSSSASQPETGFDIREDIVKAKEFLKDRSSGYTVTVEKTTVLVKDRRGRTRSKVVRKRLIEPVFLLAVDDLNERRLSLVRFTNRGCETDGFDVVRTRKNGVGSRFEVRYPENMAVLALRTMVHWGERLQGGRLYALQPRHRYTAGAGGWTELSQGTDRSGLGRSRGRECAPWRF